MGAKGLGVGLSTKLYNYPFETCGLNVGNATLKGSAKGSGKKGEVGVGVALSVEIEALKIFRLEYPILEFGYTSDKGLEDKVLGIDLLTLPESGSMFGY